MNVFKESKEFGLLIVGLFLCLSSSVTFAQERLAIGMAVEFVNHAAYAHIARNRGWF